MSESSSPFECPVCNRRHPAGAARSAAVLAPGVRQALEANHAGWEPTDGLCAECMADGKVEHMRSQVMADGDLSDDESTVLDSIRHDTILAVDGEEVFEQEDLDEPLVFRLARTFGSWPFLAAILTFLLIWVGINLVSEPFDPYPVIVFAVTSAVLASLAALQGPIIIMSQRQNRARDRRRAKAEYRLNLKAELEIQYLDEKVDLLLVSNEKLRMEIEALRAGLEPG